MTARGWGQHSPGELVAVSVPAGATLRVVVLALVQDTRRRLRLEAGEAGMSRVGMVAACLDGLALGLVKGEYSGDGEDPEVH